MQPQVRNRSRIERSLQETSAFSARFDSWLRRRSDLDSRHQYDTQLRAIKDCINRALKALQSALSQVDASQSEGEVYDACRCSDLRLLWTQRVWEFFQRKLDQRDDPLYAPILRAADEVVWSAYRQVFVRCQAFGLRLLGGPVPLPFVEFEYSPAAFPAELVPSSLRSGVEPPFLRDVLARLPVPVVRIPPSCILEPWWLIYLAHEIGHHVQYALLPGGQLVEGFRSTIEDAVRTQGCTSEEQQVWANWSREVFADIFSVLMMGQGAISALAELECTAPVAFLRRRDAYPSPAVRLHLMNSVARALGLTPLDAQDLVRHDPSSPETKRDFFLADKVAELSLGTLPGVGKSLSQLTHFRAEDFQSPGGSEIDRWRRALRNSAPVHVDPDLRAARLAIAGAFSAHQEVIAIADDDQRALARQTLARQTLDTIPRTGEPGTRAASDQLGPSCDSFAKWLMTTDRERLESIEG